MSITTAQIRGARGVLNWSQSDLAARTGISATSIGSIENGQSTPRESTLKTIKLAFENGGIEFIGMDGIRERTNYVKVLRGADGFSEFLDDVFQTSMQHGTKESPVDVFLSNVVHENWVKWMGPERWANHTKRMTDYQDIMDVRIIVKEGDYNFPASDYSQYRWYPKNFFNDQSFYSYHDRLAFLNFKENDVEIMIMHNRAFAEGYRAMFLMTWDQLPEITEQDAKHKASA